jgi:hypothetical protein
MARYGKPQLGELGAAVARLPALLPPSTEGRREPARDGGAEAPAVPQLVPQLVQASGGERSAVREDEGREGAAEGDGPNRKCMERWRLRESEGERGREEGVHLAGFEPATFGSVGVL